MFFTAKTTMTTSSGNKKCVGVKTGVNRSVFLPLLAIMATFTLLAINNPTPSNAMTIADLCPSRNYHQCVLTTKRKLAIGCNLDPPGHECIFPGRKRNFSKRRPSPYNNQRQSY
ncbi:uncharacterized protein LOC142351771 isoform X2 [Convolutriloba macropyga]|uniref:uncharacterized protein LOC142351771 isoform X2 n=1 Tax=Convolutriloba macropyga TaxID=536237 RepID=UPI003F5200B7